MRASTSCFPVRTVDIACRIGIMAEKNEMDALEHPISSVNSAQKPVTHVTETNAASVALGAFRWVLRDGSATPCVKPHCEKTIC